MLSLSLSATTDFFYSLMGKKNNTVCGAMYNSSEVHAVDGITFFIDNPFSSMFPK